MMASSTTKSSVNVQNEVADKLCVNFDDSTDDLLPGTTFGTSVCFKNQSGADLTVTPILVDFRRIIQAKSNVSVVSGV